MHVEQFYDKALAHASYAILSQGVMALVDPGRDPQPYLDFAKKHQAEIISVFETHPHADFVSSHLEFHEKYGATIFINSKVGVSYPHEVLDHGDEVGFGAGKIRALFTPGHSPDHNSYLLINESGQSQAVFTGDSLFIGDVGRPDLREGAGNIQMQRDGLARQMFETIQGIFKPLADDVMVYPAHGAGSLCGKNMSDETFSTMGTQKTDNWAFQIKNEADFVKALLEDQPFVPQYFPFDVEVNRQGADAMAESMQNVTVLDQDAPLEKGILIVDTRNQEQYKNGHIKGAINIMEGGKFETWLGTLVNPEQPFYLIAGNSEELESVIHKAAKIGYEKNIKGAQIGADKYEISSPILSLEDLKANPENYLVLDIRNASEVKTGNIFDQAINIPLPELMERAQEVPSDKPIVVHCAGGYRSAAGSSIMQAALPEATVYDLSEAVANFPAHMEV